MRPLFEAVRAFDAHFGSGAFRAELVRFLAVLAMGVALAIGLAVMVEG